MEVLAVLALVAVITGLICATSARLNGNIGTGLGEKNMEKFFGTKEDKEK